MSWQSVNNILGKLEIQAQIRAQPFQRVIAIWPKIVGDRIASNSRPVAIQRQVLRVATSSAAFAQNLMFQRQQILTALNQELAENHQLLEPFVNMRCSTADWHQPTPKNPIMRSLTEHPSYIAQNSSVNDGLVNDNWDGNNLDGYSPEHCQSEQNISKIENPITKTPISEGLTPKSPNQTENINIAFHHWAQKIKTRSQYFPLCPQCQAATPPGELARWGVCSLCVAKKFAQNLE